MRWYALKRGGYRENISLKPAPSIRGKKRGSRREKNLGEGAWARGGRGGGPLRSWLGITE